MQEKNKKKVLISKSYFSNCLADTFKIANEIAKNIKSQDIICLEGDLGVGKTVVAKAICSFFNVNDEVTSPTFTLLKTYNAKSSLISLINHFDLYRINSIEELLNIGFEEYIYKKESISLIEWPNIALPLLPNKFKMITISKSPEKKSINKDNIRIINYGEFK